MSSSSSRVTVGASYDPNDIALLFVTFLPVFLGEAMQGRMLVRVLHVVLGLMVLLSLVLTGSRGAIVALGVQACYFVLTANRFRMLAIAMVLAGALIVAMNADDKLWERFKRLGGESEQSDYNFTDRSGRIEIWKNGLGMVANNPVLGVGVGLFSTALFLIDGKIALTAHNTYLQVAAELGIPGLICYLALLCGAWRVVCRHVEDDPPDGATRWMALKISIVGFAVGSFFISAAYSAVLYFLLALVASMHFVQTTRADRDAGFESTPLSEATGGLKPHGFKLRQKKVRQ